MKKLFGLAFLLSGLMIFTSCGDDEPVDVCDNCISGLITENTIWTSGNIYELQGRVIVTSGVTLTIEPGTIIKGQEGEGANASVLMVAAGAKIIAQGTASEPIIFTSVLDNIQPGQLSGTNLSATDRGLWGGVVILGNAPISADADQAQIEGVPAGETLGLYGGSNASDNSGILEYVSIRHGGTVIKEGSEINGLTLGGVGSGTTINYIEIYGNVDDGVEFFGGTVNASNILVAWQGDDGIDIDQAYSGTVDNFMIQHGGDTDEGLEIDGPEGDTNGSFTLSNGTINGSGDNASAADFKSGAMGTVSNVLFTGYANAKVKIRASYTNNCSASKSDAFTNLIGGELVFTNCQFNAVSVYTGSTDDNEVDCEVAAADQTSAEQALTIGTATGASNATAWDSWTLASIKGDI